MGLLHPQKAFTTSQSQLNSDSLMQQLHNADPDEMASLYILLSISLLETKPEISLKYADTAEYLARLHKQENEIGNSLKTKGQAYYKLGLKDSAFLLLSYAENVFREANDQAALSLVLNLTGSLYSDDKNYQESIKYHFHELEIETGKNDSIGITRALNQIALAYDFWEKYDSALIYYDKALKLADLTEDKSRLANIQNNLGNIYLAWGNYKKAYDYYIESLRFFEDIHDSTGISKAYNNIGIIYYDWDDFDKSLKYYLLSFTVDSLIGDIYGQSQTLNNIAIVYDEIGQKEKGLRVYQRSLDLAVSLGHNYQIAVTSSNIGSFYLESGDFAKAESYYNKTLEEYKKANSIIGIAETDILLGELYKEKGEYERAMKYYESGLRKVLAMNLSGVIISAYYGLGEVSYLMGNYKSAYEYNNHYHRITDSVFNVETSSQLALLTNAYETQKKDQELELQDVRLTEQKAKIRRQRIAVIALSGTIFLIIVFTILLIRQYRLRMHAWNQLIMQHEEILKNRQKMIKAKEKAEESDKLKSSFLVNLSHELRTPMNGIMGFTDLLRKGTASEEQQQTYLKYIASSSRQLLKVLNDIIDISAIETGQLELDNAACDINSIFKELHEFFTQENTENDRESIKLILEEPAETDKLIITDCRRLSQIISNLINNALVFTKEGSVSVGYRIIDQSIVKIHVKDTGIGIERSKFEVIFDRFRQVDETTTRQHGGSGLGLAISRELLNLMEGRIYLESEIGVGSTFYVEIPYKPVDG